MKQGTCFRSSTRPPSSLTTGKFFYVFIIRSEWDRFAKTEYERLAMEEEQGEDSEVLDAMDGWDSEEETNATNTN